MDFLIILISTPQLQAEFYQQRGASRHTVVKSVVRPCYNLNEANFVSEDMEDLGIVQYQEKVQEKIEAEVKHFLKRDRFLCSKTKSVSSAYYSSGLLTLTAFSL